MFGGTPANLGMPFLGRQQVEVITGVNLPMLIKLAGLRQATSLLHAAQQMREQRPQRHLGGLRPDAGDAAKDTARRRNRGDRRDQPRRRDRQRLGLHARAAARFVHLAGTLRGADAASIAPGATIDGKSIMGLLLLAAARGTSITISADGPDEDAARRRAVRAGRARLRRGVRMNARNRHRRLARHRGGPRAGRPHAAPRRPLPGRRRSRRAPSCRASTDAQGRSRRQLEAIRDALAGVAGQGAASLFDAQLLMLDDPMLVGRAAAFIRDERAQRRVGAARGARRASALFDRRRRRSVPARAARRRADVVGRLVVQPALGVARHRRCPRSTEPWVLVADELRRRRSRRSTGRALPASSPKAAAGRHHTAILARSLGVPAVVGVARGDDGDPARRVGRSRRHDGGVPRSTATRRRGPTGAPHRGRAAGRALGARRRGRRGPAGTLDGVDIRLDANLERPDELRRRRSAAAPTASACSDRRACWRPAAARRDEARSAQIYRRMLAASRAR